ncbi:MAG TPA: DUF6463 family protein [Cryptosporangiaceae bacterium]|nr:DUF6463 family protein [Cryptosporangiaceae bacterium]
MSRDRSRYARWAGWIMVAQGGLHTLLLGSAARIHLNDWLDGAVWDNPFPKTQDPGEVTQQAAYFWTGPASFGIPVLLLGALVVWLARRPVTVPAFLGWGYGAWGVLCAAIAGPATPFVTALVPAILLVAAARQDHESSRAGTPHHERTSA